MAPAGASSDSEDAAATPMAKLIAKKRRSGGRNTFAKNLGAGEDESSDEGFGLGIALSKRRRSGGGAANFKAQLAGNATVSPAKPEKPKKEKKPKPPKAPAAETGDGAADGKAEAKAKKRPKKQVADGEAGDGQSQPKRRARKEPLESNLLAEGNASGSDAEPGKKRRGRAKAAPGERAGKENKKKPESDSELEAEEADKVVWMDDLTARKEKSSTNLRTAFSIKEKTAMIRKLEAKCFLGGRRLDEGGRPLFDDEGKVNMHFVLSSYAPMKKARDMQKLRAQASGDTSKLPVDKDYSNLKFLVKQARELRIVDKGEVKRGMISKKRIAATTKSQSFSLAFEVNLVKGDGEAGDEEETPTESAKAFERQPTMQREVSAGVAQERLKTIVATRQTEIKVGSSHKLDLEKVKVALTAPQLSFDWEPKDDEDEEGGLEVDIPVAGKTKSTMRDLLRGQISRQMSMDRAKFLNTVSRSNSGLNRGRSAQDMESQVGESTTPTSAISSSAQPTRSLIRNASTASTRSGDGEPTKAIKKQPVVQASTDATALAAMAGPLALERACTEERPQADLAAEVAGALLLERADTQEAPLADLGKQLQSASTEEGLQPNSGGSDVAGAPADAVIAAPSAASDVPVETVVAGQVVAATTCQSDAGALGVDADAITAGEGVDLDASRSETAKDEPTTVEASNIEASSEAKAKVQVAITGPSEVEAAVDQDIGAEQAPYPVENSAPATEEVAKVDDGSIDKNQGAADAPTQLPAEHDVVEKADQSAATLASDALTQGSPPDISPTAAEELWRRCSSSGLDAELPSVETTRASEISPTMPFDAAGNKGLEISPTMPFDGAAGKPLEISPTMPFDGAGEAVGGKPLEISPTMPFDGNAAEKAAPAQISPTMPFEGGPAARPVEISPTMPFDGAAPSRPAEISPTMPFDAAPAPPAACAAGVAEISPTMPFDGAAGGAAGAAGAAAAAAAAAAGPAAPADLQTEETEEFASLALTTHSSFSRRDKVAPEASKVTEEPESRKRQKSRPEQPVSDESHSGDEAQQVGAGDDVLEMEEQMSQQNREFLRHKRRKLREEEAARRSQEAKLAKKRRREEAAHELASEQLLSKADRSRYETMISASKPAASDKSQITSGLKALCGSGTGEEDSSLLSGFKPSAARKRPSFLMGR